MHEGALVLLQRGIVDKEILIGERPRSCGQRVRVNAPGTHRELSEPLKHCAQNVVLAQTGLKVRSQHMREGALVRIYDGSTPTMNMFVYVAERFTGELLDSALMKKLRWVSTESLPYARMHAGDEFWMERFFMGNRGTFHLYFDGPDEFVDGRLEDAQPFKETSW